SEADRGLSTSLRAKRSNPSIPELRHGLLRCARNDGGMVSRSRDMSLPEFASDLALLEFRGRREDRVRAAPAVPCAIAHRENAHEHTGSAGASRPSLRNGFTAYTCSPRRTAFLPPSS